MCQWTAPPARTQVALRGATERDWRDYDQNALYGILEELIEIF